MTRPVERASQQAGKQHVHRDEQVWWTCAHLRRLQPEQGPCRKCSKRQFVQGQVMYPICREVAEEMINVVETGHAKRQIK